MNSSDHRPTLDTRRLNRAVERAAKDRAFINFAVSQLRGLLFPAFKHSIVDYAKRVKADSEVIAIFESLDGYIEFRDQYLVKKALEGNRPESKRSYQITDETRTNLNVRTRPTAADGSIKDREAVSEQEERKDYPEVTPTAMSHCLQRMWQAISEPR